MPGETATKTAGLPRAIRRFCWLLASLTLACVAVEAVCGWLLHWEYPYTWPLMKRESAFRDFSLYESRFAYFHSARFFTFDGPGYLYPAPLATLHRLFYLFPHSTEVFLALLSATWLAAAVQLGRVLIRRGLGRTSTVALMAIAALCSYPFFFEFEQANLEWILCVLVGAGIVAALRGRSYTAAACFGVAGSMKFYPLALVGLLLSRRQYKQAVVALGVCVLSTLAGLWLVNPDVAASWRGTRAGLEGFRQYYMLRYEQVGFDHSVVAVMKALSLAIFPHPLSPQALSLLIGIYLPVAAFAGVLLYFDVIRRLPVINQVLCLTIATILLPPVSYDYTLLHMYLPWALLVLVAVESRGRDVPGLTAAMVCFAVLFAPVTEFIVHGQSHGAQIKAIALAALFTIALLRRFPSAFDEAFHPTPTTESGSA